MSLHLREDVFTCVANGKTVLLDLRADRYLALPAAVDTAFQSLLTASGPGSSLPATLLPLLKAGLISEVPPPHAPPPPTKVATRSALTLTLPQPGLFNLLRAGWHQRRAAKSLARRGLYSTIDRIRRRKGAASQHKQINGSALPQAILAANLRLRRYIRAQDKCLPRAIGLIDLLARHNFYPSLVIAVRMKPFEAHAWVQWEDMVLNDTIDQVTRYTPILVI